MNVVGQCFSEFVFFGDGAIASIFVLIAFILIGVKAQLPLEVMYPALMGLTFVLWLFTGAVFLMGLFLIGLVLGGILLALNLLGYLARG
jgi:hypothetical protein